MSEPHQRMNDSCPARSPSTMRFHTLVIDSSSVRSENFFCTWRDSSLRLASSKACSFTRLLAIDQVADELGVVESAVCRWC